MNSPVLVLEHVRKSYAENGRVVPVLKDVTFSVERGETIAVIGASGSGKSTLLHAAGGLDGFDAGSIRLDGEELAGLNGAALDTLRNRKLGFIYQFHHLLPEFTALENAAMPLLIARVPREKAFAKAKALLEKVGLGERLEHLPSETAVAVFDILAESARECGSAAVIVTHDNTIAARCDRVLRLVDGTIREE